MPPPKKKAALALAKAPPLAEQHAFLDAAKFGRFTEEWKALVRSKPALVNSAPSGRWSALHQAAHQGKEDIVAFLLSSGASINIKNRSRQTPLQVARPNTRQMLLSSRSLLGTSKSGALNYCDEEEGEDRVNVDALKDLFWSFDKDGSGLLSAREAQALFERLGLSATADTWQSVFESIDVDSDGELSFVELIDWLMAPDMPSEADAVDSGAMDALAKELGLLDAHLLYGMSIRTLDRYLRLIDVHSFDRAAYFAKWGKDDWLTPAYGAKRVGYDVGLAIRQWLESNGYTNSSALEVLHKQYGWDGIGKATVFVSHVQSEPIEHTLLACRSKLWCPQDALIWLDYVVLRQCQHDFDPGSIAVVIKHIAFTIAITDEEATYNGRAFCIFEVAATPDDSLTLLPRPSVRKTAFVKSSAETASAVSLKVDSKNAQTRCSEDKAMVDEYITRQFGGFERVDASVKLALSTAWERLLDAA
eukprot:TRINITY_DN80599_c0_g1_i1.p1 TRINITY_DN80599_c0_g1~~TRINITY_DN80599_c0_g1_i1.p1  ORF type:complete len:475 (-),score=71.45 TRINITY_DN80599_c0_g1_i1:321-1745(-)